MTDNRDIFRLLLLMLLLMNDKEDGVTGTLNTMMIMALLTGSANNGASCPPNTPKFPDE